MADIDRKQICLKCEFGHTWGVNFVTLCAFLVKNGLKSGIWGNFLLLHHVKPLPFSGYTKQMQIIRFITKRLLGSAVLLLALSGCNRSEEKAANVATGSTAPAKGAVTAPVKVNGKAGALAPAKMTVSQTLGVDILKALNAAAGMKGHQISVGTTSDTVILNGKVKSAAQKKTAEIIARQKAKTAKVINKTEVSAK